MRTLIVLLVVMLSCGVSYANLVIDVRAADGQVGVSPDGKTVVGTSGDVLTMQVWATVFDGNGIASDDGVGTVTGGIELTGGGALALDTTTNPFGYVAPFDTRFAEPNVTPTLLGLGGSTAGVGPMMWVAQTIQLDTVLNQSYLLGTFKFTVGNSDASINYLKPGSNPSTLLFKQDGVGKTGQAISGLAITSAGAPCTVIVPEPSTITLLLTLAMGGLLLVRRRS